MKRALHGVPSLTWNQDLADYAQQYIDELDAGTYGSSYGACSGNLLHSSRAGLNYGENLAYGTISATQGVDLWYDEIVYYDIADPASSIGTFEQYGHFTQVVWKSTSQLGCVVHECSAKGTIYLICEYHTEGNIFVSPDEYKYYYFKQNVLPLV